MLYLVLLMMVAGFLALRLYSVLGKRTGHEQALPKPAEDRAVPVIAARSKEALAEASEPPARNIDTSAEAGLRAIVAAEPDFDVARFVEGAQGAYRMTLEAFWRGDEDALRDLVSDDVRGAFAEAIAERNAAGHVLNNRLVTIERTQIAGAAVTGREARITVRFDADIAAVTRDAEGHVIAGSTSDAVETHDVWTFARTLKSNDPNWVLVDTDEA